MDIDNIFEVVASALTEAGLRGNSEVPTQINPPASIIGLGAGDYADSDDDMTVQFGILVLFASSNAKTAQKQLRTLVAPTGSQSIKEIVESAPTGVSIHVHGWDPPAVITIGGVDYLGIEFTCEAVE